MTARRYRTLGLGRILGDAGSASDVSEDALRAVADAYVGRGPETALSDVFCRLTNSSSVAEMLEDFSRGGEPALSAAPEVLRVAEEGDEVARRIVAWAGEELGWSAALVARRLGMDGRPVRAGARGRPVPQPQRAAAGDDPRAHARRRPARAAGRAGRSAPR